MLKQVYITDDCYNACISHALTSEEEEIMGLLLGDIEEQNGHLNAYVWDVCMLTRIDKRKDRVEISPAQLVHATNLAEDSIKTRVIGWYHSHPHFNPFPSHVDLRCQGNYQQLEKGFVGLIFSVFNTSSDHQSNIQLHAFQSRPTNNLTVPEEIFYSGSEDEDEFEQYAVLTPVRSTPFESVNIPVQVIPSNRINYVGKSIERIISLQEIMLEEEKNGLLNAQDILKTMRGQAASLNRISNLALYQRNLTKIMDQCMLPLLANLKAELENEDKE